MNAKRIPMHENDFLEQSKVKIVAIHSVLPQERKIKAVITTSHFGRLTTKPYEISKMEWEKMILRGYIE